MEKIRDALGLIHEARGIMSSNGQYTDAAEQKLFNAVQLLENVRANSGSDSDIAKARELLKGLAPNAHDSVLLHLTFTVGEIKTIQRAVLATPKQEPGAASNGDSQGAVPAVPAPPVGMVKCPCGMPPYPHYIRESDLEAIPGAASNGDSQGAGVHAAIAVINEAFAWGIKVSAHPDAQQAVAALIKVRDILLATPHTGAQGLGPYDPDYPARLWVYCGPGGYVGTIERNPDGVEYVQAAPVPSGEPREPNKEVEVDGLRPQGEAAAHFLQHHEKDCAIGQGSMCNCERSKPMEGFTLATHGTETVISMEKEQGGESEGPGPNLREAVAKALWKRFPMGDSVPFTAYREDAQAIIDDIGPSLAALLNPRTPAAPYPVPDSEEISAVQYALACLHERHHMRGCGGLEKCPVARAIAGLGSWLDKCDNPPAGEPGSRADLREAAAAIESKLNGLDTKCGNIHKAGVKDGAARWGAGLHVIAADVRDIMYDVQRLRALLATPQEGPDLAVSNFKCSDHGAQIPIPACPKCIEGAEPGSERGGGADA